MAPGLSYSLFPIGGKLLILFVKHCVGVFVYGEELCRFRKHTGLRDEQLSVEGLSARRRFRAAHARGFYFIYVGK